MHPCGSDLDFVETYTKSQLSGVGHAFGCRYQRSQQKSMDNIKSDRDVQADVGNVQMFGIFSGFHDDGNIAEFVMKSMLFEIYSESPLSQGPSDPELMMAVLNIKYRTVVKRYEQEMESNLSKVLLRHEPIYRYNKAEESDLERHCKGGCTALIVIRKGNDLFVLNCGTSSVIAISEGQTPPLPLCESHDNENEHEFERLRNCGVDPAMILRPTRAIGDPRRNLAYKDTAELKHATSSPVISDPDIKHYKVNPMWTSLVLISGGVCQNLKDTGVEDIAAEVAELLKEESTPTSSAQALVDTFCRKHQTAFERYETVQDGTASNRREEMTVMYVRLRSATLFDLNTIGDSLTNETGTSSTDNSLEISLETLKPYIDLDEDKIPDAQKFELKKFLL